MDQFSEKLEFIMKIIEFIENQPYDPDKLSRYTYIKTLDYKIHQYNDEKLDTLLDLIIGMSAGDEFHYSKNELICKINSYISDT